MIAAKMAAMGMWPQAFSDVSRIAAAGTNGLDGTQFNLADTVIVMSGTGAIVMKQLGAAGDTMSVVNATGAAVNLYAQVAGKINGAVTPFSVGAAHCVTLKCLKPGNWFVVGDVSITGTVPSESEEVEAPPA